MARRRIQYWGLEKSISQEENKNKVLLKILKEEGVSTGYYSTVQDEDSEKAVRFGKWRINDDFKNKLFL